MAIQALLAAGEPVTGTAIISGGLPRCAERRRRLRLRPGHRGQYGSDAPTPPAHKLQALYALGEDLRGAAGRAAGRGLPIDSLLNAQTGRRRHRMAAPGSGANHCTQQAVLCALLVAAFRWRPA
ncbi:MAG: hypothetical protein H6644_19310 [Caldilineaceae bacterium]|nr:hypothetical protein [Caldilineaceae bacterium]